MADINGGPQLLQVTSWEPILQAMETWMNFAVVGGD